VATVKGSVQIDLHHAPPVGWIEFPGLRVSAGDPCIVDEDIDLSKRGHGGCGGGLDGGKIGKIHCGGVHGVRRAHLRRRLRERGSIHIPKRNTCTRGEKTLSNGTTDPSGTSRDDGNSALEVDLIHTTGLW
jgi:hypothetical protein